MDEHPCKYNDYTNPAETVRQHSLDVDLMTCIHIIGVLNIIRIVKVVRIVRTVRWALSPGTT